MDALNIGAHMRVDPMGASGNTNCQLDMPSVHVLYGRRSKNTENLA